MTDLNTASQIAQLPASLLACCPLLSHMGPDRDTVHGPGCHVAHVLGTKLNARALLTGSIGSTGTAEFASESNPRGQTQGVAEDNKGNVYKASVHH